jgi:pyrimidine operon attenuation protein/uracil phosphoribosyltransferase
VITRKVLLIFIAMKEIELMGTNRIRRSLKRIALQIWEDLGDEKKPVIIGLNERGYAVSKIIYAYLKNTCGVNADLAHYEASIASFISAEPDLDGRFVILVDDVIFSASTMFNAILNIFSGCTPAQIKVAVLLDRGHRKFPVEASYTGSHVPTKQYERIDLILDGAEPDKVLLTTQK